MKNWINLTDPQPFKDIAIFSADFYGHSYWSTHDNQLTYVLHFVDRDMLPEDLCLVAPEEAADLRKIIEKFGPGKDNYWAVWNWARERGDNL
jgi:hypothetical protein